MNIFSQSKSFSKVMTIPSCVIFSFLYFLSLGCGGDDPITAEEAPTGQDPLSVTNELVEDKLEDSLEPQI